MFPDARELERRAIAIQRLPWALPASVVVEITDADLDALTDVGEADYWRTLNLIVGRIVGDDE